MPTAYEHIVTATVSNATTTQITFSNIPTTYGHLLCLTNAANVGGGATGTVQQRFNGDTGQNYGWNYFTGNGADSSFQGATQTQSFAWGLYTVNANQSGGGVDMFSNGQFYYPAYRRNLTLMQSITIGGAHNNVGTTMQTGCHTGGSWNNSASVTEIRLTSAEGAYIQGSIISLYGLLIT